MDLPFEIVGSLKSLEIIARGKSVRERRKLRWEFGPGRWRKLKGIASVRLVDGTIRLAEIHWYEAHGIGRRKEKIKRFLD